MAGGLVGSSGQKGFLLASSAKLVVVLGDDSAERWRAPTTCVPPLSFPGRLPSLNITSIPVDSPRPRKEPKTEAGRGGGGAEGGGVATPPGPPPDSDASRPRPKGAARWLGSRCAADVDQRSRLNDPGPPWRSDVGFDGLY
jgi:hypothetical protein